jgi:hypothetical protein
MSITSTYRKSSARGAAGYYLIMLAGIALVFALASCTKDISINLPPAEERLVVEGHISTGQPPYVLLSKNSDFYSTFYLDSIASFYVHDAVVIVSDGSNTDTLTELSFDTAGVTVSAYVGFGIIGQEEKTYTLTVYAEGKTLTAVTTIPKANPLDSIWWQPANTDIPDDTLIRLVCRYSDPVQPGNHVRYFTKVNSEPFYPGYYSTFSDDLVNGTTFNFSLDRGVNRADSNLFDDYGLFHRGDTIAVGWYGIDKAQYDFWRTLESEINGQGNPFATPVFVQGNINGGLGIWGGYAPTYKSLIVPK